MLQAEGHVHVRHVLALHIRGGHPELHKGGLLVRGGLKLASLAARTCIASAGTSPILAMPVSKKTVPSSFSTGWGFTKMYLPVATWRMRTGLSKPTESERFLVLYSNAKVLLADRFSSDCGFGSLFIRKYGR